MGWRAETASRGSTVSRSVNGYYEFDLRIFGLVEFAQRLAVRPPVFVVGFQREINIGVKPLEVIKAIVRSNVGPDREVLRILEKHYGPVKSVASLVGNDSAYRPGGEL